VAQFTQLSPGAQKQLDDSTGGQYNILAVNYMNSNTTMGDASAVTANLGFSMSSLERILVIHRKTGTLADPASFSNSRVRNGLTEFSFLINSEQYPARPINVDANGAEAYAELLVSDHSLTDFVRGSTVNIGAALVNASSRDLTSDLSGVAPNVAKTKSYTLSNALCDGTTPGAVSAGAAIAVVSNIGTFITGVEFESGISDGRSSHIYSGISTIASTVSYRGAYDATVEGCQIDFFASYTVLLSLDMRGLGIWQMRV
jgi:hypothetical protein